MRNSRDDATAKINASKAHCADVGSGKNSLPVGDHKYPKWENQWCMFTENYYEAIGGYIALMANENFPEYHNFLQGNS